MPDSVDSFTESVAFSRADVDAFSAFSHDVNPLHTDPAYARKTAYGEPVVFGVLGVLACLKATAPKADGVLHDVRIEWRNALFPDVDYFVDVQSTSDHVFEAELRDGARTLVRVEAEYAPSADASAASNDTVAPTVGNRTDAAIPSDVRTAARTYDADDLDAGLVCEGAYATDLTATDAPSSFVSDAAEQIGWARTDLLAFVSYLAGMEVPGRRALLYRADLTFERDSDEQNASIDYRAEVDHYDDGFGMLSVSVDARHGRGVRCHGTLTANVREELGLPRADAVTDALPDGDALNSTTALVTGASRGFGAAVALALAARGTNVAINFHKSRDAAEAIRDAIADLPGDALLVQGDAADPDWVDAARASIVDAFGGLDLLVCNAATPPQPTRLTPETRDRIDDYVAQNFALVSTPLAGLLDELDARGGTVAFVSSIFAETAPDAFPQYTASKTAGEGLIRSTAAAYSDVDFAIARPPRMRTGMSNTSLNAQNALAPETAAAHFVAQLASLSASDSSDAPVHVIDAFDASDVDATDEADANASQQVALDSTSDAATAVDVNADSDEPVDFECAPGEGESHMVYVAATFTTRPVVPGLQFWRDEMDQDYAVRLAPYNQVFQQLLTPNTPMLANEDGLNVLMIRWADWLREIDGGDDLDVAREHVQSTMDDFTKALNAWADRAPCQTLVLRCPSGEPYTGDAWDDLFGSLDDALASATHDLGTVDVVHTEAFHDVYGVDDVFDPVRDRIGHIPFRPSYYHFLSVLVARRYHALKRDPFKVIVSDCDNTLWGGVVGEEGPDGVDVDGRFRAYQEMLLEQKEKGMVICLASKNIEQNVTEVFEQRSDMALGLDDVVDHRINWDPKSENIASLAESLNLGLDSFIFLDDNPVEVGEVRSRLPQVLSIEWPESDEGVRQWLNHLWALDHYSVTGEDAKRTQRYQAQVAREELESETLSFGNFISSLDLNIDARPLVEDDVPRTAQLTQRTNQFNFSQIRRNRSDVRAFIDASTHDVWTFRASDRFGDYGLVGVLIVDLQGDAPALDTFVLSCRVLGRGVEHRMMQKLGAIAEDHGADAATIRFNPTVKNEPAQRFLDTIAPIDVLDQDDAFEVDVAASTLRDVTFEPDDWEDPREQVDDDGADEEGSAGLDVTPFRDRNALLRRVVTDLSPLPNLVDAMADAGYADADDTDAVSNDTARAASGSTSDPAGPARADVEQTVIDVFADQLSISAGDIRASASMEDYIGDSFQIVGITVELKKHYPSVPETILFEHTTLDGVIDAIADDVVADASGAGAQASSATPSGRRRERPAHIRDATSPPDRDADSGEPIAVIGMNGRYPSGDTLDAFWETLRDGRSAIGPVPSDRWALSTLPEGCNGECLGDVRGGFVDAPFQFDAPFFRISPREARLMDPQQRLFLEVVWGLLEDAGYTPKRLGRRTGVFAGVIANDYAQVANDVALDGDAPYRWSDDYQIANRISYAFDFQGPSLALDTACSSSGTAMHLACKSLQRGECDAAVVGGVNLFLHPSRFVQYDQMQIISPDGTCRPFGEGANGTVYGEGVGALLLKPLSAAERDGDNIHGVIRGTAVNSGGRTNGFTVPNPNAQSALIQEALDDANVTPGTIDYVEAHGTGTSLGDPIEVRGLTDAFASAAPETSDASKASCAIGSVKGNIGHLESAAAIAGVTKVLLQLKHDMLAPSLHAETTNDGIDFDATPFRVQRNATPWTRDGDTPRRAGVSSFGAGGSNAHVIVEEYVPTTPESDEPSADTGPALVVLSAQDEDVLHERARQLRDVVTRDEAPPLASIAYTLQVGRKSFEHRLAIPARSHDDLAAQLDRYLDDNPSARTRTGTVPPDRMDDLTFGDSDADASYLEALAASGDLDKIATLWTMGATLDWDALHSGMPPRRVSLPVYPFRGDVYRLDPPARTSGTVPASPVGSRIASRHVDGVLYQTPLGLKSMPTLADHTIYDTHVVPGALYVSHALTVAEAEATYPHRFEHVTFPNALRLSGDDVTMECHWTPADANDGAVAVELASRSDAADAWTTHCTATYCHNRTSDTASDATDFDLAAMRERCSTPVDRDAFYDAHRAVGFEWGAAYQGVQRLWTSDDEALAWIERPDAAAGRADDYALHPAVLDACFQVFAAAADVTTSGQHGTDAFLPIGVDAVTVLQSPPSDLWSYARVTQRTDASLTVDVVLLDADGTVCAVFHGLNVLRADRSRVAGETSADATFSEAPTRTPTPVNDLLYAPTWTPVERTDTDASTSGRWLLVSESPSVLESIRQCAETRNVSVETIAAGDATTQRNGQPFPGEFDDALGAVLDDGPVDRVVYVAPPLDASGAQLNLTTIRERLRTGTTLVQTLVRRIADGDVSGARLWTVTHGAQCVEPADAAGAPTLLAPLWGLGRALRWEQPDAWGGAVDLPADPTPGHVDALLDEIAAAPDGASAEDHVAVRDQRYVFRLDAAPDVERDAVPDEPAVHDDGAYLVTGAFGSLGMRVAEWLVEEGATTLALVSRSGPSDAQRDRLDAWRERGVDVRVHSIDVTDADAVGDLLDALDDVLIRGILHGAGVLDDGLLMNLDWDRCWSVLAPKVAGAWHLHEQTARRGISPDAFVLFSSASALLGAPGQANYAAANLFLSALAVHRRASERSGLAVDWGPWSGAGMSSRVSGSAAPWTDGTAGALDPDDALAVLKRLLRTSADHVAALPYDWADVFDAVDASRVPSVLRGRAPDWAASSDEAQSAAISSDEAPESPSVEPAPDLAPSAGDGAPSQVVPETHSVDAIRTHIVELAAAQLGYDDPDALDTRRSFADLGFDSLMAVNLRNDLNAEYDLNLPASVLFDYPTAATLARHVHQTLDAAQPDANPSQSDAASSEAASASEDDDDTDAIASLSDDEVNAMIEDELDALDGDL